MCRDLIAFREQKQKCQLLFRGKSNYIKDANQAGRNNPKRCFFVLGNSFLLFLFEERVRPMASASVTDDGLGKRVWEEDRYEDDYELSNLLRSAEVTQTDTTDASVHETCSDQVKRSQEQPSDSSTEDSATVPQTNILLSKQTSLDAYNKYKTDMTDLWVEMQTKSDEIVKQLQGQIASLQNTNHNLVKSHAAEICNLEQGHATELRTLTTRHDTIVDRLTEKRKILGTYHANMKKLVKEQSKEFQ